MAAVAIQCAPALSDDALDLHVSVHAGAQSVELQPAVLQRAATGDSVDAKKQPNMTAANNAIYALAAHGGVVGGLAARAALIAQRKALRDAAGGAMIQSVDWALDGASAAAVVGARPMVLLLQGAALGDLPSKGLSAVIVRLDVVGDAFRTASHTELRLSKNERTLNFTDEIVPSHVARSATGIEVVPDATLAPGEYAVVLRPLDEKIALDDAAASMLSAQVQTDVVPLWQFAWDFKVN